MTRTGYFCAHYYLDHLKHYPPLVRLALSHANTPAQIQTTIQTLQKILA
jgi:selenocysteine lyase/cysteine desulfurase